VTDDHAARDKVRVVERCLLGLLAIAVAVRSFFLLRAAWAFTTDDAYITLRYAKNLASGDGLLWNVTEAPVEGYSNFTYVLLGGGALAVGLDPILIYKWIGCGSLVVTCFVVYWIGRRWLAPLYAMTPVILLTGLRGQTWWAPSGLETCAYQLMVLGCIALVLRGVGVGVAESTEDPSTRAMSKGDLFSAGGIALCAALTRPEGPLVPGCLALGLALHVALRPSRRGGATLGEDVKGLLCFCLPFAIPYLLYTAWRVAFFDRLLPNTVLCKGDYGESPYTLLIAYWRVAWPVLLVSPLGLLHPRRRWLAPLLLLPALYGLILIGVDPIIGHFNRHFIAAHGLVAIGAVVGVSSLLDRALPAARRGTGAVICAGVVAVASMVLSTWGLRFELATFWRMSLSYQERMDTRARLGAWLDDNVGPRESFVLGDVGLVGYLTSSVLVDAYCLNNRAMTEPPIVGDVDAFVESVFAGEPEVIVLTSSTSDQLTPRPYREIQPTLAEHPDFDGDYSHVVTFASELSAFHYFVFARQTD